MYIVKNTHTHTDTQTHTHIKHLNPCYVDLYQETTAEKIFLNLGLFNLQNNEKYKKITKKNNYNH